MATQFLNRKVYYRDDVIFREGEPGDCAYLIERGEIQITKKTPDGDEIELGRLGPGAIFGEMAMIDMQPRMAKATAMIDTTVTRAISTAWIRWDLPNRAKKVRSALIKTNRSVRSCRWRSIAG